MLKRGPLYFSCAYFVAAFTKCKGPFVKKLQRRAYLGLWNWAKAMLNRPLGHRNAGVAQLVEHQPSKLRVAGSSLVASRSIPRVAFACSARPFGARLNFVLSQSWPFKATPSLRAKLPRRRMENPPLEESLGFSVPESEFLAKRLQLLLPPFGRAVVRWGICYLRGWILMGFGGILLGTLWEEL